MNGHHLFCGANKNPDGFFLDVSQCSQNNEVAPEDIIILAESRFFISET
jgi:hypothetical protein